MLFNSVEFFVLLAVTLTAYWLVSDMRLRQGVLAVASLIFYATWSPPYLLLLFAVVAVTYVFVAIDAQGRRWALPMLITLLIALLGSFKYADFGRKIVFDLGLTAGPYTPWHIVLPLGISFWVFQLIAYAVDVRRGQFEREPNPLLLGLFIMFFPHLIAGPICRPHQLLPQLKMVHRFDVERFVQALLMIACGLFLKVVIADNLSGFVDLVFAAPESRTSLECLAAAIVFGIVIFCDFWGYSTMAVGAALTFGIVIPQNFNLPYAATSIQDFWRRWHITLSNWLRDYLYKPLGGSRYGELLTYRNLLIVMVLGGLWHGANYTFLVWGAMHGGWLAIERFLSKVAPAFDKAGPTATLGLRILGWFITMLVVFIAWVFFRAESVPQALTLLGKIASFDSFQLTPALHETIPWVVLFLVAHIPIHKLLQAPLRLPCDADGGILMMGVPARSVAAFWLVAATVVLGSGKVADFVYFQF